MLLLPLTLVGFPADQQVQGMCHAEGVLLCQVVDRKGSPVPQCHSLAQQRGGGAQLELLALSNRKHHTCGQKETAPAMQRSYKSAHCRGGSVSSRWCHRLETGKRTNLWAVRDVHVDFAGGGQRTSFSQGP